ncbi:hypothetical protein IQ13_3224 [Lacibacter cauensis]|uniref:Uncharacterized protein n=1 Tax=Lacibacter cauensis TaxID=510947 RepID=A0A562SIF4_9BACT|nr:hypothetical protein [Lacibacter cauensis]TWI80546.1 hypothetical protein IQ13_3224 [Lacibacter cauensis]
MAKLTNPLDPDQEAHMKRNIKWLLQQYFSFRAYVKFKDGKARHFYGNEHQCTYNQLQAGIYPNIRMDKEKGYTDLINLIERSYKGKYTAATIYMRNPGEKDFNTVCRNYYKGEATEINDPVITDPVYTLYYIVQNGRVLVQTEDPAAHDFKNLVNQNLNK